MNFVIFVGISYKDDAEILYALLVQPVGASGYGSNIIANNNISKNGRCFYLELKGCFITDSLDHTKSQRAEKKLSETSYSGENRNWEIEDYYNIISKSFNDLEQDVGVYSLS